MGPVSSTGVKTSSRSLPGWIAICILCAITVALRATLILAPPAELAPGATAEFEELLRGMTAKELCDGPLLDLFEYQWNATWGGSLVISIMAAPFYLLLGPTVPALRCPTLIFACIGIMVVFKLLDRFASRRAAWVGGLLLALAPPGYSMLSSTAWGTHVELNVLVLALAYLFFKYRQSEEPRARDAFALGLLTGFGIYFGMTMAVMVLFFAGLELWSDRGFWKRRIFLVRVAGFLIGCTPWFLYRLWSGSLALSVNNHSLGKALAGDGFVSAAGRRMLEFFTGDFAASLYFPEFGPVSGAVVGMLYGAALFSLLLLLLWRSRRAEDASEDSRRRLVWFLASYVALFLGVYSVAGFDVSHTKGVFGLRYLMPFLPWLIVLAALAIDNLWRRGGLQRDLAAALVASLAIVSLAGNLLHCRVAPLEEVIARPGYDHDSFASFIAGRLAKHPESVERTVDRLLANRDSELHTTLLFGIGQTLKQYTRPDTELPDRHHLESKEAYLIALTALHDCVPMDFKPYFEEAVSGEKYYTSANRERFERNYRKAQRKVDTQGRPIESGPRSEKRNAE